MISLLQSRTLSLLMGKEDGKIQRIYHLQPAIHYQEMEEDENFSYDTVWLYLQASGDG